MNSEKNTNLGAPSYLYHWVPENLEGDLLYPLNILAEKYPHIFAKAIEKYAGREHLRKVIIPIFNCLWNDVIHMTPIYPSKTKQALLLNGNHFRANQSLRFFVIPPEILQPDQLLIFKNSLDYDRKYDFMADDFERLDIKKIRELDEIPARQIRYFKEMAAAGERPLLWKRTPHIFYRGSILIKDLETIEW